MFTSSPLIAVVDDDRAVVQLVTAFLEAQNRMASPKRLFRKDQAVGTFYTFSVAALRHQ
jgi:hypothetical protein